MAASFSLSNAGARRQLLRLLPKNNLAPAAYNTHLNSRSIGTSDNSKDSSVSKDQSKNTTSSSETPPAPKKKTQAELDKELELKMQGLAGDGGESGVELEDGQPVSMKRSVRNNMFRYI